MLVDADRWIPHSHNFSLTDPPFVPDDMRVAELKNNRGSWNEALVRAMFSSDDAKAILGILESSVGVADVIRWYYSKDGEYSVNSGYRVAMSICSVASSSTPLANSGWWNSLWKIAVPKVKLFAWRVCKGWIPVKSSLVRRKVVRKTAAPFVNAGRRRWSTLFGAADGFGIFGNLRGSAMW